VRAAQEQLQLVTDTMAASVTRCSADGRYTWVSRSYAAWYGREPRDIVGRRIPEVIGEEAYAAIRPHIAQALSGKTAEFEVRVNLKQRGAVWVDGVYMPTFDSDGVPDGFVGVVKDITGRRELENTLKEADRRKDEFLATLAHELRNPLAPLKNAVEILRGAGDDARMVEKVRGIMERQVGHMARLIDDLLDLSRVSRGTIELRRERIDVAAAVRHAVEASRPLVEAAGHDLALGVPGEPVFVHADLTRLAQVFANLVNNAGKYTEKGGRIALSVAREGSEAVVRVRDNGQGIPAHMLRHVFDLFVQADASQDKSRDGVGIGLTIVRRIVEMHAGSVEAYSAGERQGSEFVVRLPALGPEP
jgi:PAS domain S-box-containing protein